MRVIVFIYFILKMYDSLYLQTLESFLKPRPNQDRGDRILSAFLSDENLGMPDTTTQSRWPAHTYIITCNIKLFLLSYCYFGASQ